jgi:GR25 family glycosyltransferase involved in LPS biosynthesis
MFHLEGYHEERDALYRKTFEFFNDNFENLESPTIKISNREEYESFVFQNPDFVVDPKGYEWPPGVQGWKFGELGIWASTITAVKKFLQTDYEYLLILEDDIDIATSFREHLKECIDYLGTDFDIFMFFNPENNMGPDGEFNPEDIGIATQNAINLCYVITRSGAQKTIDYVKNNKISSPIDWHYFNFHYPNFRDPYYKTLSITKRSKKSCWFGVDFSKSTIQNAPRQILEDSDTQVAKSN